MAQRTQTILISTTFCLFKVETCSIDTNRGPSNLFQSRHIKQLACSPTKVRDRSHLESVPTGLDQCMGLLLKPLLGASSTEIALFFFYGVRVFMV